VVPVVAVVVIVPEATFIQQHSAGRPRGRPAVHWQFMHQGRMLFQTDCWSHAP